MKKIPLFCITIILAAIASACTSTAYYQVCETKSNGKLSNNSGTVSFEDENCKISYNLWRDGGNAGFVFYNKTEKKIILDMRESYFLVNGISQSYFRNRVYTKTVGRAGAVANVNSTSAGVMASSPGKAVGVSTNNTLSSGLAASEEYSVSFAEEDKIQIPPHTSKVVQEYSIWTVPYRDCSIIRYPFRDERPTVDFSKETSPITFGNNLVYTLEGESQSRTITNSFYVSKISNLPTSAAIGYEYPEYCGQKSLDSYKVFKDESPDRFFIRYVKSTDVMKH